MFKRDKSSIMERVEKLIDESIEFYESDFDEKPFKKLNDGIEPGDRVQIIWDEEYGYIDYGYIFSLPGFFDDEWDLLVHIPEVYCEKGGGHPEWVHLFKLLAFEHIKEIRKV